MSNKERTPTTSNTAVDQFLTRVANTPLPVKTDIKGRLVFAMDATASRETTWDTACQLQGEMFSATDSLGGLMIQLCYYRGFNEFSASHWFEQTGKLQTAMSQVKCRAGQTQIHRVLRHLNDRNNQTHQKIQAAVFVGDAVEENVDKLYQLAGKLRLFNIPLFIFHEGHNIRVESVFRKMAQLSAGAYAPFDLNSASQLKELLSAVAVFAAGGRKALRQLGQASSLEAKRLLQQLEE